MTVTQSIFNGDSGKYEPENSETDDKPNRDDDNRQQSPFCRRME